MAPPSAPPAREPPSGVGKLAARILRPASCCIVPPRSVGAIAPTLPPWRSGHSGSTRVAAMPFSLRNLKQDLDDVGPNFDGDPELEFRLATDALGLEHSGL